MVLLGLVAVVVVLLNHTRLAQEILQTNLVVVLLMVAEVVAQGLALFLVEHQQHKLVVAM
jgi:hypothetical protein